MGDWELLRRYVETRSDEAFAELVRRHIDWVYAAAVRQVRQRQVAEDVTQAVFVALSRRAGSLHRGAALTTWLFQVTRYASAKALRSEMRRRHHEQEAAAMACGASVAMTESEWEQLAPMLDELAGRLRKKDQQSVLLRFYQRKSFAEVGEALGISEEAARKRVGRAVEKLRQMFGRKGFAVASSEALSAAMVASSIQPAGPMLVGATIDAGLAAARGTAVAGHVFAIAKGAMRMMILKQAKVVAALIVTAVVAIPAVALLVVPGPMLAATGGRDGQTGAASAPGPVPAAVPATQQAATQPVDLTTPEAVARRFVELASTGKREELQQLYLTRQEFDALFGTADPDGVYRQLNERIGRALDVAIARLQQAQFAGLANRSLPEPVLVAKGRRIGPLVLRADTFVLDNVRVTAIAGDASFNIKLDEMIKVGEQWKCFKAARVEP